VKPAGALVGIAAEVCHVVHDVLDAQRRTVEVAYSEGGGDS
jgi:hypothetical protein